MKKDKDSRSEDYNQLSLKNQTQNLYFEFIDLVSGYIILIFYVDIYIR